MCISRKDAAQPQAATAVQIEAHHQQPFTEGDGEPQTEPKQEARGPTAVDERDLESAIRILDLDDYEKWSDEDLIRRGQIRLAQGDKHEQKRIVLGRMTIDERLDAGHALSIVRQRHKGDGTWCKMQDEHGLSRTTVWEVIEVYEQSAALGHTQEEVAAKHETWTEVLLAYGVARNREAKEVAADDMAKPAIDEVLAPDDDVAELPALDHAEQPEIDANQDSGHADAAPPVPDQAEQPGKAKANSKPPKVNAVKKEQIDISPCEIDAATAFVMAVGNWARAVVVLQSVKEIVGG